jgi:hypothetical protein
MSTSRRSSFFSRRSFVEKLGLGAGAALMAPLARNLIREAHGQPANRKVAMFYLAGNGISPYWVFTPAAFQETNIENEQEPSPPTNTSLINSKDYTLPEAFSPLAPYRNSLAMLDGFRNNPRMNEDAGHGLGWMALSDVPGNDVDHFSPGGITLDQQLAKYIGADTPRRAVLLGASSVEADLLNNQFAEGVGKSLPAFQNPTALFRDVFGNAPPPPMMQPGETPKLDPRRPLFDVLKNDIRRLEAQFAAPERDKLSQYLAVVEDQEKALAAAMGLSCNGGEAPMNPSGNYAKVVALHAIASAALTCGMTNVLGLAVGTLDSHDFGPNIPELGPGGSLADVGHEGKEQYGPVITNLYKWFSTMAVETMQQLNGAGVENVLAYFASDNGEQHHSGHGRCNAVLAGKAPGLKLEGQFVRLPGSGARSMIDMHHAILQGFGVPDTGFGVGPDGQGPNERGQGPFEHILA